ncbi:hypothetical protein BC476_18980 [Vibrio parahaemolyticus]|uniref:hypothetical protein n=1 Tax=Vibrio parahaemolyticus TaxID=670 RepID=UPI00083B7EF2|nr:hypothetical protein [Vibrio parahaemolyticus]ODA46627.1 hypothetical protein BC476_18980 [Vibrio parahaemolyticus]
MSKPIDQLIQIVNAGGNIVIGNKPTEQLVALVEAAAKTGSQVTIKSNKPLDDLILIANSCNGNVTFDLSD